MKLAKCIDCGREFVQMSSQQVRCEECQIKHRQQAWRDYHLRKRRKEIEQKNKTDSMVINGHVQICRHIRSCFYGQDNNEGCAYALEENKTRMSQGLFIVDGKCPAFRKKKKGDKLKRTRTTELMADAHMDGAAYRKLKEV